VLYGLAKSNEGLLRSQSPTVADLPAANRLAVDGSAMQTSSAVLAAAAGVAVVTGLVLALLPRGEPAASASLAPVPGGAVVVVGGSLP
jgi:hypothetical protein